MQISRWNRTTNRLNRRGTSILARALTNCATGTGSQINSELTFIIFKYFPFSALSNTDFKDPFTHWGRKYVRAGYTQISIKRKGKHNKTNAEIECTGQISGAMMMMMMIMTLTMMMMMMMMTVMLLGILDFSFLAEVFKKVQLFSWNYQNYSACLFEWLN